MSIVSNLLGVIDDARALLDDVGLRSYEVSLRTVTYAGTRVGEGAPTTVDTPITVAKGKRPKVSVETDRDVAAGRFSKTTYKVGPLTPPYSGGGVDPALLDPAKYSAPTEVFFVLKGPGLPTSGTLCKKVADNFERVFGYTITIESIGREA